MDLKKIASNFSLGYRYMYNNKYSFEVRYGFKREILAYNDLSSSFNNLQFNFGYTVF